MFKFGRHGARQSNIDLLLTTFSSRPRRSTPSTASAASTIRARALSRALPPRSHRWIVDPIGGESGADIGIGRGGTSSNAQPVPEDCSLGHASSQAKHVMSIQDEVPSNAKLSWSSPILSFWPPSIRKCVYHPVLSYNQCISFVALRIC